MSIGYPNQNGGRSTDVGLFHAIGNAFIGSWISGFKVRQASPLGMKVLVGGQSEPDDLLLRSQTNAVYPVYNSSTSPVQAIVPTANSANPRVDAVVVYIDSSVMADQSSPDSQNKTKIVVVTGTPATNPSEPSASQIRSAVGASSAYVVLATIRVDRGTTTVTDSMITDKREPIDLRRGSKIRSSDQIATSVVQPHSLSPSARGDYTTAEVDTGKKWIDGRAIYRKTVSVGAMPSGGNKNVPHGVVRMDRCVSITGTAVQGGNTIPLPFVHESVTGIKVTVDRSNVVVGVSRSWAQFTDGYVTFEYVKLP